MCIRLGIKSITWHFCLKVNISHVLLLSIPKPWGTIRMCIEKYDYQLSFTVHVFFSPSFILKNQSI